MAKGKKVKKVNKNSTISDFNKELIKRNTHEKYDADLARFYKKDRREVKKYKRSKEKRNFSEE